MRRKGVMLCYPLEEKRLLKWPTPYICQPKLDGDRCRAVPAPDGYKLLTSEENEITHVPHIIEDLNKIPEGLRLELDGELYNHNLAHHEIHSIVSRKRNQHDDYLKIQFHVFDLCIGTYQFSRISTLIDLFEHVPFTYTFMVDHKTAYDINELFDIFNNYIKENYEGIIVRNISGIYKRKRSTGIMKFKPTKSDWYEIVGVKEEADKNGYAKGTLGSLLCRGDDGTIFSVGSGLTRQQRQEWWKQQDSLYGLYCKVQYQRQNKGTPIFPVFLELDSVSGE